MFMSNVVEQSFNIAWGFLVKSGEITRPDATANFLLESIRTQMRLGEYRPLMLANRAIHAFQTRR
ncbi:hypothetical protein WN72_39585 [Bradyrhizobium arachidis]|uniref:Uncharacterized protein n=1 Tax=Bradyrhizobium arachidis TaxID=858423 RepID=A0AAE7NUT6_9BRAD|nr:hypothetical protein [Bradyrhizobium arachidis]QOZ71721.1 hypothetical protein WN72_39585 [Bradyrhizobium arachidis]